MELTIEGQTATRMWMVVGLCFLAAVFEGLDIQSMGVAAPRLAPAFHLGPEQMGAILSASTVGLMLGAALGGWASDRLGRKKVLVLSMLALGIFSLFTTTATEVETMVTIRVLAGLGLGGAFPNLIALATDVAPPRIRVTALGIIYCGMPLGGAAAGALMSFAEATEWRLVFFVGGIGPLAILPLLITLLPSRASGVVSKAPDTAANFRMTELFGARARQTLLLWLAFFFTLLAVYLLLNWLPSLMVGKGLGRAAAASSAIYLNVGAMIGSLVLGRLSDRGAVRFVLLLIYTGMVASLIALVVAKGALALAAAFAAGFFVIGGQLILYALAPTIYPLCLRGTGIGAAIAVGRLGSVLGPLLGGLVLAHGFAPDVVPAIAGPGLLLALAAALALVGLPKHLDAKPRG